MSETKVKLNDKQMQVLKDVKARGKHGMNTDGPVRLTIGALERRGLVEKKAGMERTYVLTDAGRDFLAANK